MSTPDCYHRTLLHLVVCIGIFDDEAQKQENEKCEI